MVGERKPDMCRALLLLFRAARCSVTPVFCPWLYSDALVVFRRVTRTSRTGRCSTGPPRLSLRAFPPTLTLAVCGKSLPSTVSTSCIRRPRRCGR